MKQTFGKVTATMEIYRLVLESGKDKLTVRKFSEPQIGSPAVKTFFEESGSGNEYHQYISWATKEYGKLKDQLPKKSMEATKNHRKNSKGVLPRF